MRARMDEPRGLHGKQAGAFDSCGMSVSRSFVAFYFYYPCDIGRFGTHQRRER